MIKKDMAALKFEFKIFLWKQDLSKATTTYSRLPNNRPPWNKRPGWKIKVSNNRPPWNNRPGWDFYKIFLLNADFIGERMICKSIFFS